MCWVTGACVVLVHRGHYMWCLSQIKHSQPEGGEAWESGYILWICMWINAWLSSKLCNCNILKACWLVFLCDQLLALEWSLQLIVAFAAYVSPLRRIFSDHCNIKRKWRLLFLSTCEWYLVILLTALWNSIWYWPTSKVIKSNLSLQHFVLDFILTISSASGAVKRAYLHSSIFFLE